MAQVTVRNRNKGKKYKDGRLKPPNWEYRFEGASVDGKRKQITKAGYKSKSDALKAGNEALTEYNNAGKHFEPSEISYSDYLDYWLKNYCLMNIADSTYSSYASIIDNHIKPSIGYYKLKSIDTMILQEFINDIAVNKPFSKSFIKNILKVIKGSFKYAFLTAKLIRMNPAQDVIFPKISLPEQKEVIVLSKNSINTILNRFETHPTTYYAMLTAYYTGLRVGEVFGLTWDCIDFERKTITVNKVAKKIESQYKNDEGIPKRIRRKSATKWYFGACKNKSSYRTIDIGDTLINALKEFKAWQEANEQEYGEYYTKHYGIEEVTPTHRKVTRLMPLQDIDIEIPYERVYPVFIKENGEFRGTSSMKYPSKIINVELGINFNFHALRHTHATMLIEAGSEIKTVSQRLGHSSVRTTIETYVHVTQNMKNNAVNIFEQFGDLTQSTNIINFPDEKRNLSTKTS